MACGCPHDWFSWKFEYINHLLQTAGATSWSKNRGEKKTWSQTSFSPLKSCRFGIFPHFCGHWTVWNHIGSVPAIARSRACRRVGPFDLLITDVAPHVWIPTFGDAYRCLEYLVTKCIWSAEMWLSLETWGYYSWLMLAKLVHNSNRLMIDNRDIVTRR